MGENIKKKFVINNLEAKKSVLYDILAIKVNICRKQKYRSVEQDRKPRDKPTHLWSTNL